MQFKWLGTAGLELQIGSKVSLIDPYLSRHSLASIVFSQLEPDIDAFSRNISKCDHIFVSHSHFDHISDVAEISKRTGAGIYASQSGIQILLSNDIQADKLNELKDNTLIQFEDFHLRAINGKHIALPWIHHNQKKPTLRRNSFRHACDFRMDMNFSFFIETGDFDILVWNSIATEYLPDADVVFIKPQFDTIYHVIDLLKPGLVIPIHWDEFWKKEISRTKTIPISFENNRIKIKRVDWNHLISKTKEISPATRVLIPQVNHVYRFFDFL